MCIKLTRKTNSRRRIAWSAEAGLERPTFPLFNGRFKWLFFGGISPRLLNDLPLAFDRAWLIGHAKVEANAESEHIPKLTQWIMEFATEGENKKPSEFLNVWWSYE
jgi:hypothetical protein